MLETSTTGLLLSWRRGLDRQVHAPIIPVWPAVLMMNGVNVLNTSSHLIGRGYRHGIGSTNNKYAYCIGGMREGSARSWGKHQDLCNG